MAWATVDEVEDTTGVTVTATDLAQAQAVIEIYANRNEDATDGLIARDIYWLQMAVCWQAAWQSQQYGYASRTYAWSHMQDGLSVMHNNQSQADLAPLAARALKNLSWKGSKTIVTRPVGQPRGGNALVDLLAEANDEALPWDRM